MEWNGQDAAVLYLLQSAQLKHYNDDDDGNDCRRYPRQAAAVPQRAHP